MFLDVLKHRLEMWLKKAAGGARLDSSHTLSCPGISSDHDGAHIWGRASADLSFAKSFEQSILLNVLCIILNSNAALSWVFLSQHFRHRSRHASNARNDRTCTSTSMYA